MLYVIDPSTAAALPKTDAWRTSGDGVFVYTLVPAAKGSGCAVVVETVVANTVVAMVTFGGFADFSSARTWVDIHSSATELHGFPHVRLAKSLHRWAAETGTPLTDLEVSWICA